LESELIDDVGWRFTRVDDDVGDLQEQRLSTFEQA